MGSGSRLCAKVEDRTPVPNEEVLVSTGKPSFSRNIQVIFKLTFPNPTQSRIQIISWISSLQWRLEWKSGKNVAQRTPLSPVSMVNMQTGVFIWRNSSIHSWKFHFSDIPCILEAVVEAVEANTKVCQLLQSPQFPSFDSSAVVRFPGNCHECHFH